MTDFRYIEGFKITATFTTTAEKVNLVTFLMNVVLQSQSLFPVICSVFATSTTFQSQCGSYTRSQPVLILFSHAPCRNFKGTFWIKTHQFSTFQISFEQHLIMVVYLRWAISLTNKEMTSRRPCVQLNCTVFASCGMQHSNVHHTWCHTTIPYSSQKWFFHNVWLNSVIT